MKPRKPHLKPTVGDLLYHYHPGTDVIEQVRVLRVGRRYFYCQTAGTAERAYHIETRCEKAPEVVYSGDYSTPLFEDLEALCDMVEKMRMVAELKREFRDPRPNEWIGRVANYSQFTMEQLRACRDALHKADERPRPFNLNREET